MFTVLKIRYSVILILVTVSALLCQVNPVWVARYDGVGSGEDVAYAIASDNEENLYITGESIGQTLTTDFVTIKYDSLGNEVWVQLYDGPAGHDDKAVDILIDEIGNTIVTGSTWSSTGIFSNYATVKYDVNGNELWSAVFDAGGSGGDDMAKAVALDDQGNIYVTGVGYVSGTTGFDYVTLKYDSDGNELWMASYNGSANWEDFSVDVEVDSAGNIYVTGLSSEFYLSTIHDIVTVKYDPDGNVLWVTEYDTTMPGKDDGLEAMVLDEQANIYITGYSKGSGNGYDYFTVKYDSSRNQLWAIRYDGPGHDDDLANAIVVDRYGNVYVTGGSTDIDNRKDYTTIKYDTNGNELWVARYKGPGNSWDIAYTLVVDNHGCVFVSGASTNTDGNMDYVTIKYDSLGNERWIASYDGPAGMYDGVYSMVLDSEGDIVVTGGSNGFGDDFDYATVKYWSSDTTNVSINNEIIFPDKFYTLWNHPNPFNSFTSIVYDIPVSGNVNLVIYDLLGNKIARLVNKVQKAGKHSITWDASDMSSGIYLYNLKVGSFTITRKMLNRK